MSGFVSRSEARLAAPTGPYASVSPEAITAHYGGPSPWSGGRTDHDRCASIWRAWQAFHQSKGWVDIAYTSGVCPHGFRYEGRPRNARTAAQGTNEGNRRSLAVCYIAGTGDVLTPEAKLGFLAESQRLGLPIRWCHWDWHNTGCPGVMLCSWVRAGCPHPGGTAPPPQPSEEDIDVLIIWDRNDAWLLTPGGQKIYLDPESAAALREGGVREIKRPLSNRVMEAIPTIGPKP